MIWQNLFKVFADSTRIRILFVLFESEVCVCDLAKALNMTQSAVSHQLQHPEAEQAGQEQTEKENLFFIPWLMTMYERSSPWEGNIFWSKVWIICQRM